MSGRRLGDARLAASEHHPKYPPPAFMDETELRDMEHTRAEAEEIVSDFMIEDPPAALVELVHRDVPALIREVRHLNRLLGRDR